MSDKVHGGTPKGSTSLCVTCRNAHRVVGINMQSEIRCVNAYAGFPPLVKFPVAECNHYDDLRIPALYQMEKIAWTVESRNRGPVGFGDGYAEVRLVSPQEREANQPSGPTVASPSGSKS